MADKQKAMRAAEEAIASIGLGYDLTMDLRLKHCKNESPDSCLLKLDEKVREIVLPGGVVVPDVSTSIKCDKGERTRFSSDVLSFQQMSEQFNQEMGLSGKVPSGLFNNCFQFKGCWQEDASNTKALAFDGWFITLYNVALAKSQIILQSHVKEAVPSSWDPDALASFIEKYGTHIVVGVKMGGNDVVYVKQTQSSTLQAANVQRILKEMADKRFLDTNGHFSFPSDVHGKQKIDDRIPRLRFADVDDSNKDVTIFNKRKGGNDYKNQSHNQWQSAIQFDPDVISMSFVPITSLLGGVPGSGFLNHAINLYLRYKPQIEELHQFLEFQLPRHWAPVFSDLPLGHQRRQRSSLSLQFSFMGPKLYINTNPVNVGARPITGMRLYLEGKKCDQLAIHLQHLSSMPKIFQIHGDPHSNFSRPHYDHSYYEAVQWKRYSHICTAPVQSDDDLSIVTGAQFQIESHGLKKVLFLRLRFSRVSGVKLVKNQTWEGAPDLAQKSGFMSTIFSGQFSTFQKPIAPRPTQIDINSAVYPDGPPVPVQSPKMLKFVDTTELIRGPQHTPGYWVVSGAKLEVVRNKISLRVKYSLLTATTDDLEEDIDEVPSP